MTIVTLKRLPQSQEEINLLTELFGEGLIFNLFDENGKEPVGFREATDLELKFLSELKERLEQNQNSKYDI